MKSHYYAQIDGEEKGPYDYDSLELMWKRQELKMTDHVRRLDSSSWVEVATIAPKFGKIGRKKIAFRIFTTLFVVSGLIALLTWCLAGLWAGTSEHQASISTDRDALGAPTILFLVSGVFIFGAIFSGIAALGNLSETFSTKREIG